MTAPRRPLPGRVAILLPDDLPWIAYRVVVLWRQRLNVGDELEESVVADTLHDPVDKNWWRPNVLIPRFCGQKWGT